MQIKKTLLLSVALVLLAAGLFLTAKVSGKPFIQNPKECYLYRKCSENNKLPKIISPWNFFTEAVLHLTA